MFHHDAARIDAFLIIADLDGVEILGIKTIAFVAIQ
jgi:hypothetical protein